MTRRRFAPRVGPGLWLALAFAWQSGDAAPDATRAEPVTHGGSDRWASAARDAVRALEYRIRPEAPGGVAHASSIRFEAPNRAQDLRTHFEPDRVRVTERDADAAWEWSLALAGVGSPDAVRPVAPAERVVDGNRIEYRRDGLVEWYVNDSRGLEQGFTIDERHRPAGDVLVLRMRVGGNLEARDASAQRIRFADAAGITRLRYDKLRVDDAEGRTLPARFGIDGRTLEIRVDVAEAAYPIVVDPLTSADAPFATGSQFQEAFGAAIAVGDVNGDGYADTIVGAPSFDGAAADEGAAFLFLGSATGPATTPAWQATGAHSGSRFGETLAVVGDVNGDGFDDVVVGAWRFSNGEPDEGAAYLYLGSAAGLAATPDWWVEGSDLGATLVGFSVASAGDIDGDGLADVIVGAPPLGFLPTFAVGAFVFTGASVGDPLVFASALDDPSPGLGVGSTMFGWSVASAGDFDGDGYGDVVVGACRDGAFGHVVDVGDPAEFRLFACASPSYEFVDGAAYVFHGSPTGFVPQFPHTALPSIGTNSGYHVAPAGDVDGDGRDDVIVTANGSINEGTVGRLVIYRGVVFPNLTNPIAFYAGDDAIGLYWDSVTASVAGDLDGDGRADLVIGASIEVVGALGIYPGTPGGFSNLPALEIVSPQSGGGFGGAFAAGDVDRDGYLDLAIGGQVYSGSELFSGAAFVERGPIVDAEIAPTGRVDPKPQEGFSFGFVVAVRSAGDVDGDGFDDVLIGRPDYTGVFNERPFELHLGSAAGPRQAIAWEVIAFDVVGVGDVDGDGYGDLGVLVVTQGPTDAEPELETILRLDVVRGGLGGPQPGGTAIVGDLPTGLLVDPSPPGGGIVAFGQSLGPRVAGAGDVNGDGYADVVLGSPFASDVASQAGRASLYLGSASGVVPAPAWEVAGAAADDLVGLLAVPAGDVNGDGYGDVLIGDSGYGSPKTFRVFHGGPAGLAATAAWQHVSAETPTGPPIGASAGDVDGDGHGDLAIGEIGHRNPVLYEGQVLWFPGSASGLAAEPAWSLEGGDLDVIGLGGVLAAADLDGDGFDDLAVGSFDEFVVLPGSASGPRSERPRVPAYDPTKENVRLSGIAGDVDGDAIPELLVDGTHATDYPGGALLTFGGLGRASAHRAPRQRVEAGGALVAPLGRANETFDVDMVVRGQADEAVKLEVEACPAGASFGSPACVHAETAQFASPPGSRILLVDDDDDAPDVRSDYQQVLTALGLVEGTDYDVWITGNGDGLPSEPSAAVLASYSTVIWFTGAALAGAGPAPDAEAALADYLGGGGCLLVSSQGYLYDKAFGDGVDAAPTPFMIDYLGVAAAAHDQAQGTVTGVGPFAGLGALPLGFAFPNASDALTPSASAAVAFAGDMGDAGVAVTAPAFASTFWAFPLEALVEPGRSTTMAAVLSFCAPYARGVSLGVTVSGQSLANPGGLPDGLVRWRARSIHEPIAEPFPPSVEVGPWRYLDGSAHGSAIQLVLDQDADGTRDNLDADDDDDGANDGVDAFALDPAASVDTDGDGQPDAFNPGATPEQLAATSLVEDTDDDGDGVSDADEIAAGTDPLNVAPSIGGAPDTTITPGAGYGFTPIADDGGDGGPLAFSLAFDGGDHTALPAWLDFEPSSGTLASNRAVSNDDFVTLANIVITASDGLEQAPLPPFDLSVLDTRAPVTVAVAPAGTYPGAQSVTLTCVETIGSGCAATHYTIDGGPPTFASPVYAAPIPVPADATLQYFSVDGSGNAEPVRTSVYSIDPSPPAIAIVAPLDGALVVDLDAIDGTSSDVGTGVQSVSVSITNGTSSVADVGGGVLALVPGPATFVDAADGGGDYATWSLDTSSVNWTDGVYTVAARAVDGAGSEALAVRTVEIFAGVAAATTLTLDLTAPSIVFGGEVDATVKLTKTGFPNADLSGSAVTVRVFDPSDVERAAIPVFTNSVGQATLDDLGSAASGVTFDADGAWRLEASFAGTLKLAGAFDQAGLLVGTSAGYAVIVQGRHPSGEGLASHGKTAGRVYRTLRRRGFEEQNIFYFNHDPSQDANGDGVPDNGLGQGNVGVDAVPTKAQVLSTIEDLWQLANANPAPIYTVLVDHGGEEQFFVNTGAGEVLTPAELDAALDALESGLSAEAAAKPRVVVTGACYSGSFIPQLAAPGRLLITSAASNEESYKGPLERDGVRVGEFFLEELFKELETGSDFLAAFETATERTETFTRRGGELSANSAGGVYRDEAAQHPLLHDDGDPQSVPVNALKADSTHGALARSLVLGLVPPSSTNVVELVADIEWVTPTVFLPHDDGAVTLELLANFVSEVRQAFVEMRGAEQVLTAGNGTEQLEAQYQREAMSPPVDPEADARFTVSFADGSGPFGTPGTHEVFYHVEDVDADDPGAGESRRLSSARRSVVYRNRPGNSSPSGFALLVPGAGATTKTVLGFDWADAVDADGLTYTLRIAQSSLLDVDGVLSSPVHVVEESKSSSAFVGLGILEDQTVYHWQVEAIDRFGARTPGEVRSFATDNQNVIPGVIRGVIRSDQTSAGIAAATVTAQESGGGAPRPVPCPSASDCFAVEVDGVYYFITLPGTFEMVAQDASGAHVQQVKAVTLPQAQIQPNGTVTGGVAVLDFDLSPDPVLGEADLELTVSDSPDPVDAETYGYAIAVANAGPDPATESTLTAQLPGTAVLVDVAPEQGTCALAVTTLTCALGAIASGESVDVTATLAPTLAGVVSATFTVSAQESDPDDSDNAREVSTTVAQVFDADVDGVVDGADNCPLVANPDQADGDEDGAGDACDAFPGDPGEQLDTDGDEIGNNADLDDDGDDLPDAFEAAHDCCDPLDDSDRDVDSDADGLTNYEEFLAGTDPDDPLDPQLSAYADDLIVDFGQSGVRKGLWLRKGNQTWTQIETKSPADFAVGDCDGNGQDDVLADFGQGGGAPTGLRLRKNDGAWTFFGSKSPQKMLVADVDGNGSKDFILDYGVGGVSPNGLWVYKNCQTLTFWQPKSPLRWVVTDIEGDGADDVLFDFGQGGGAPTGLYWRKNDAAWVFLYPKSVVSLLAADLDGNGSGDVVIDFGGGAAPTGTWIRKNDATWVFQHPKSPVSMWRADCDGTGQDDVLFDFGQGGGSPTGLWWRMNDSAWTFQHPSSPQRAVVADADGNGADDVLLDFGQGGNPLGLWWRKNCSTWFFQQPKSSETMAVGDVDESGGEDVVIDFGAALPVPQGLWQRRNDAVWEFLQETSPERIGVGNFDGL